MIVTARYIESIKNNRVWDAEKVEIKADKNGKKFVHFYLTPATANGTTRLIKRVHILRDGKVILRKKIGNTWMARNDSFEITMPVRGENASS